jgi:alpha-beta hydrolase superfamily lysophospholipase
LVLTSGATGRPREYDDACSSTDIVLDVHQIRKWAPKLSDHVTLVKVHGALHDVTMSRQAVRDRAFEEISAWHDAYLR